jgi:mRNA interferase RelE/StbE
VRYRLVYTRRAVKDIEGSDPSVRERLGKALLRCEEDPLRHVEKLTQSKLGSYPFRIGDYRVVFDLERDEIIVLRVGHRREIYKRS